MKGRTLRSLVALAMLLTLASLAGEAWARAGSGGSRGSRSYSQPSRPAPSSPGAPSRQSTAPAPAASPMPRPSPFGGMMGMLGGFMLGGLLGGLLFGGLGGGLGSGLGIGLFDIVLIGGGLFLLYKFMQSRRQAPQPAYAGGVPSYAGAQTMSGGGTTVLPERPPVPDDLDRGLAHVRQMDSGFDAAALASDAAEMFRAVQTAMGAGNMAPVSARVTPDMAASLDAQVASLRRAGHTNHVERIQIERAEVTEAWQERGTDFVTVVLSGTLLDYTTDSGGAVVAGSRTSPDRFEEYWTFTRPVGPNAWRLTAIQAG